MKVTVKEECWAIVIEGEWRKVSWRSEVPSLSDTQLSYLPSESDGKVLASFRYEAPKLMHHRASSPQFQGCVTAKKPSHATCYNGLFSFPSQSPSQVDAISAAALSSPHLPSLPEPTKSTFKIDTTSMLPILPITDDLRSG